MIPFTQTSLAPGNCLQTAVACLLDVPPSSLPSQTDFAVVIPTSTSEARFTLGTAGYEDHLRRWLSRTVGIRFLKSPYPPSDANLDPFDGWHLLFGPTERTEENGLRHAMVGFRGQPAWDPHPSRAGLTVITHYGWLEPG
jgi:hypothetical protein